MTDRERRLLVALKQEPGKWAGRLGYLAFPESRPGRRDVGARNTLKAMRRKGWVRDDLRDLWWITRQGNAELQRGAS